MDVGLSSKFRTETYNDNLGKWRFSEGDVKQTRGLKPEKSGKSHPKYK